MTAHTLTVFNAVDVPESVQEKVLALLGQYNPDIYQRSCDAEGRTA
jgi:hypothetical protein